MATKHEYHPTSPYYTTETFGDFLDLLNFRPITKRPDDIDYVIEKAYAYRPQALAFDLYGDTRLWWVFAARNPNKLKDPLFDFVSGLTIKIPYKQTLIDDLGL
jgi:hypothetical protein